MADATIADPPAAAPAPNPQPVDLDSYEIPFDSLFFSAENDPNITETFNSDFDFDFGLEENGGVFELTFDDLDDLCLPGENDEFIIPDSDGPPAQKNSGSESSGISADSAPDVVAYLNHSPSESGSYRSADQEPAVARVLNVPSVDCDGSSDREFSSGPVSSQGSGNGGGGSGVSDDMNSPTPEFDNSGEYVSSRLLVDQKVKVEETGNNSVSKRKKDQEDTTTKAEYRNSKCRKSVFCSDKSNSACNEDADTEEEEKRKARLMRNRESAQLSRQRKKHYVEELEEKVRGLHSTIADLNNKISFIMAENVSLRQQLGGGAGMCPAPPPGMYPPPPMAHMAYPWVPCAPYVVKPQGSHVPLVPIPRLKPQQPAPAPKLKKAEGKKGEGRTKKVASVSFLGLLFFVLLFGGLVPMVNVRFGGIGDRVPGGIGYFSDGVYDHHRGRVLAVTGHRNGTFHTSERGYVNDRTNCERVHGDEAGHLRNGSEPLVASLYVPRNDKLVKIDGNLIINSVLASEKAKASPDNKNDRNTDSAMLRNLASALAIPEARRKRAAHSYVYMNPADRRRALAPSSNDPLKDQIKKSVSANGRVQEWFREGLAGPMLSSGMCTEVFRFDITPSKSQGAIIPAPSVGNITAENRQNSTAQVNKGRNRRTLRGAPFPLPRSGFNETQGRMGENPKGENLHQGNKSLSSSMVVSVLVDPREAVDAEVDGVVPPPKSLPRIFVVVLLDSINYVTYSCMLPHAGGPQLVTT